MDALLKLHLQVLHGRVCSLFRGLTPIGFSSAAAASSWSPNLTVYRCSDRFLVWVDLAGVERTALTVRAEARRLSVAGRRLLPIPEGAACRQVLALEIDEGDFYREVPLPDAIDPEAVKAEHRDGLLRIDLPFAPQAAPTPPP